jgi:drug/metabolite transporter (DMT)-like permease
MKEHWYSLHEGTRGVLAGVASAVCLAGYFVINKYIYNTYQPSAVEYTLLFALAGGVFGLGSLVHRMDRAMYSKLRQDTKTIVAMSAISFLSVGLLVIAQRYTSSVNVALLSTLTIVTTMFFSYVMLGEHPNARQRWWLIGLFAGLYVGIVGFHGLHLNKGDVIVLCAEVFFGFNNVLARKIMKRQGSFVVPNARLVLAAGIAIVVSLFVVRHIDLMLRIAPLTLLAGMFYWLTMKTFAVSVHLVNANHAVVLNNSQIFFTSLAGVILLGESYSWEKLAGSVVALTSIYYIAWKGRS